MAAGVMVLAGGVANAQTAGGFSDVPGSHWAAEAVAKVADAGIVRGYPVAQNPKPAQKQTYNGDKPVTRYELAVTLYRFVLYVERADRQKKGNLKVEAPIDGKEAVKRLIAEGYLPRDTPLAKEGSKVVTANELADAMTHILTRVREKSTPITPESLRDKPVGKPVDAGT
jgi:hypothetical protein